MKKILGKSKLKAFASDKFIVAKMIFCLLDGEKKKIVGKGENAGYQHFLLLPRCVQKASYYMYYTRLLEIVIVFSSDFSKLKAFADNN